MIKSLSPYNLQIPFIAPISGLVCTSYTLQIFVWNGIKTAVPSSLNYEMTKLNATSSNANDEVNIALLVNDFIDFSVFDTTNTELINGNNQYWVKTQVLYITADPTDNIPNYENVQLMTAGYGYGMQGQNTQLPTNKILLQGNEFKVNRNGFFVLPILIEQPATDPPEIVLESVVFDDSEAIWKFIFTYTANFTFTTMFAQNKAPADPDFSGDLFSFPPPSPYEYSLPANIPPVTGLEYRVRAFDPITETYVTSNEVLVT